MPLIVNVVQALFPPRGKQTVGFSNDKTIGADRGPGAAIGADAKAMKSDIVADAKPPAERTFFRSTQKNSRGASAAGHRQERPNLAMGRDLCFRDA
jgi:hypothetical protein